MPLKIPITELRFFMDGSEGSLWPVEVKDWPPLPPVDVQELYVNAAQLVAWLKINGIKIT